MSDQHEPRRVTVGILTYNRREGLLNTLEATAIAIDAAQATPLWQLHEVLVIDNSGDGSARSTIGELRSTTTSSLPVRYIHEPRPGLAAARNRALDEATGEILVFVDDDERPEPGWPGGLIETMAHSGAALVGGPVRTAFIEPPPRWVLDGRFFERAEPVDGARQPWLRSGNLAIDLAALRDAGVRFDERFARTGGEDVDLSRRAAANGLTLRWSATAAVVEDVGPERVNLQWLRTRERRSTANWVRVETALQPSLARRCVIAARAVTRLAEGLVLGVVGTVGRRRHVAARGAMRLARAQGAIDGLRDRSAVGY